MSFEGTIILLGSAAIILKRLYNWLNRDKYGTAANMSGHSRNDSYLRTSRDTYVPSYKTLSDPLSSSIGSSLPHNVFNTSYRSGKY